METKKDYPEIEKIFIDYDRKIHKMRKNNFLPDEYLNGYEHCFKDIRNCIIELIKK